MMCRRESPRLKSMECVGIFLKKKKQQTYDVRCNSTRHDLRKMKVLEVFGPEMRVAIVKINWAKPLNEQILVLADGSIALLQESNVVEPEYEKKVNNRTNNYLQDKGWKKNLYMTADKHDNNLRTREHGNEDWAAKKSKSRQRNNG